MTRPSKYPPRTCTMGEIDLMVALNRQGWTNREIAQEIKVSGRCVNAYLNLIRIRGVYPGGAPVPSPKPTNLSESWAMEQAPGFVWTLAPATVSALRIKPADGARFEIPCPLDVDEFAQQVGEGRYVLWLIVGDVTLFTSQLQVSPFYGPPKLP